MILKRFYDIDYKITFIFHKVYTAAARTIHTRRLSFYFKTFPATAAPLFLYISQSAFNLVAQHTFKHIYWAPKE